jgi:hypothetical protein
MTATIQKATPATYSAPKTRVQKAIIIRNDDGTAIGRLVVDNDLIMAYKGTTGRRFLDEITAINWVKTDTSSLMDLEILNEMSPNCLNPEAQSYDDRINLMKSLIHQGNVAGVVAQLKG